ncbi:DUF6758 family protein [Nocardioides kribbensis]|uniref:DUF6758 family protein n=1 Tax=Nocardioides kribbensis TaxID=305517 RepID=UPI00187A632E|nr:DUF6758 family protein [Nocardioides kribbensis]
MPLSAACPRCPAPVAPLPAEQGPGLWSCPEHGAAAPLWRPSEVGYADFTDHLEMAGDLPSLLPWPLGPDWSVTGFGVVAARPGVARAVLTACTGTTEADGPVDVVVVTEEAGTGLGARVAGAPHTDPGYEIGGAAPVVRLRVEGQQVPLWAVSTSAADGEWDRSVLAGEAHGRWLWVVVRPAPAVLLLHGEWHLRDVSALGPGLVELPFGGPAPAW